jgi:hypothetical protein
MRTWLGSIAVVCCVAAVGGIAYIHGFERALGHVAWQHRLTLIRAYSDEIAFRGGPCVLLAVAAVLAARSGVLHGVTAAIAVAGLTGQFVKAFWDSERPWPWLLGTPP